MPAKALSKVGGTAGDGYGGGGAVTAGHVFLTFESVPSCIEGGWGEQELPDCGAEAGLLQEGELLKGGCQGW